MRDFLRGMGSIIDIYPSGNNRGSIDIPTHSDAEALRKDWEAVGRDLMSSSKLLRDLDEKY